MKMTKLPPTIVNYHWQIRQQLTTVEDPAVVNYCWVTFFNSCLPFIICDVIFFYLFLILNFTLLSFIKHHQIENQYQSKHLLSHLTTSSATTIHHFLTKTTTLKFAVNLPLTKPQNSAFNLRSQLPDLPFFILACNYHFIAKSPDSLNRKK